jgi:hypothetical protein
MTFNSRTIDVSGDIEEITEQLYRDGKTDGLPVVPPTPERVEEMLSATDRDVDEQIGIVPPQYRPATVEKVAINSVMAGCDPSYLPVIVTALEAMLEDEFNLYGINATTHPVAPLLMVNGPVVDELNINYGYNVFGQGWRANSTIGRAIRLVLLNVGGANPGDMDRATHGHPGKYSYCIAENEKNSPWEPLHVQRGFDADRSTVTVFGAEAPHEVNDHVSSTAEGILTTTADSLATMAHNNAYVDRGEVWVVFGPEHAQTVADDGWSKADVQQYIYEHARNELSKLKRGGMYGIHLWSRWFDLENDDTMIPVARSPEQITVAVAGGAGKHSMAIPSFGTTRSVTKPIGSY